MFKKAPGKNCQYAEYVCFGHFVFLLYLVISVCIEHFSINVELKKNWGILSYKKF